MDSTDTKKFLFSEKVHIKYLMVKCAEVYLWWCATFIAHMLSLPLIVKYCFQEKGEEVSITILVKFNVVSFFIR